MTLSFPESYGEMEILAHYGATGAELDRRLAEREQMSERDRWQLDVQVRAHVGPTLDDHRHRWGAGRQPSGPEDKTPAGPDEKDDTGEQSDPDDVPAGTMADVLDWIADDPARARAAIVAEQRRDDPRSSLLGKLRKIADG